MDAKMTDNVNSPDHYARFRFTCEPKDLTKHLPHPLASAIEYIIRAPFKGNEIEDLRKACFWLGEFVGTSSFWEEADDGNHICRLNLPLEAKAAAFALISQSQDLKEVFEKIDFPNVVTALSLLRLTINIGNRATELEFQQPSK